jgi:hypothetical protein
MVVDALLGQSRKEEEGLAPERHCCGQFASCGRKEYMNRGEMSLWVR